MVAFHDFVYEEKITSVCLFCAVMNKLKCTIRGCVPMINIFWCKMHILFRYRLFSFWHVIILYCLHLSSWIYHNNCQTNDKRMWADVFDLFELRRTMNPKNFAGVSQLCLMKRNWLYIMSLEFDDAFTLCSCCFLFDFFWLYSLIYPFFILSLLL